MFQLLLYIHILSAVLSIGPFFVLIPIFSKMKLANEKELEQDIQLVRFVVRLSKHSSHVLVASGVLLVWTRDWSWLTSWIVMSLVILFSTLFFIARAFSPILRKLQEPNHDRSLLIQKLTRALYANLFILLLLMWFMVAKPSLW